MKKVLVLFGLMMLIAGSAMAAGAKIAFVDTQSVFDKTKMGKKYQGVLREYFDSRKKILDMDADEIRKLQEEYDKQAAVLNDKAKREKEASISGKVREFEKKRSEFNNEIAKKNDELSAEFNQKMIAVLKEMAKKEKTAMVLNKTINVMSKGEIPSVLYADDDLDLTDKVIAEMDKKEETKN